MRLFGRDVRALYGPDHRPRLRRGIAPDRRPAAAPVGIAVGCEIHILTWMVNSY